MLKFQTTLGRVLFKEPFTFHLLTNMTSRWGRLCQTLVEVSMNKIALWRVMCSAEDDWTAEWVIVASNAPKKITWSLELFHSNFFWNSRSWYYWYFCLASNENKLEILANQINLNSILDLSRAYWIKSNGTCNSFSYLSKTKMPIMPTSGVSKNLKNKRNDGKNSKISALFFVSAGYHDPPSWWSGHSRRGGTRGQWGRGQLLLGRWINNLRWFAGSIGTWMREKKFSLFKILAKIK